MGVYNGLVLSSGVQRMLPAVALWSAMALWGSSFVALKYSFQEMHPLLVIWGRMAVATLCFLPFWKSLFTVRLRRNLVLLIIVMCLCEPCCYFLCEAAALTKTSASQAAMITTMLPLMVAVAAGLTLGEHITPKTVAGFVVAAAGAVWLSLGGPETNQAPNPVLGNFLEFLAMIFATAYTILMKRLSKELHPFFLTGIQAVTGALFFAPVLLFPAVRGNGISWHGAAVILYLGIVVSMGAYGLYNYGVSRIPASQASAYVNLIPVFSILLSYLFLGDHLSLAQWAACALVFGGVLMSQDRHHAAAREGCA